MKSDQAFILFDDIIITVFGHVLRLMITSSLGENSPLTVYFLFGIQIVNPFVPNAPFLYPLKT